MASWRETIFQLALAIMGSSLLGFAFNIFIQPNIDIQINSRADINSTTEYHITSINRGLSSAQDLRLSVFFAGNFTDEPAIISNENISSWSYENKTDIPTMITIDTKRFSPNAFLGIITTINQSKEDPYYISATYGQDTVIESRKSIFPDESLIQLRENTLVLSIAALSFAFYLFLLIAVRRTSKFIPDIIEDIVLVRNTLSNNASKHFFGLKTWNSKKNIQKHRIIYDHDDYKLIDEMYHKIRERDLLLQHNIDFTLLTGYNKECYELAKKIYKIVVWSKYERSSERITDILFLILTVFLGSFIVNYFSNNIINFLMYRLDLISMNQDTINVIMLIVRTLLRSTLAFAIIIGILKFRSLIRVINIKIIKEFSPSLTRRKIVGLFILSYIIINFPIPFLPDYVLGVESFLFGVSFITMIKMFILILIVSKINTKNIF